MCSKVKQVFMGKSRNHPNLRRTGDAAGAVSVQPHGASGEEERLQGLKARPHSQEQGGWCEQAAQGVKCCAVSRDCNG